MDEQCKTEVAELHQFFEDWFTGHIDSSDAAFSRVALALSQDFLLIAPSGVSYTREPILAEIRDAHGSRQPDFRVWIEAVESRMISEPYCLLTYQEWQDDGVETSARISTALFRAQPAAPNGVEWVHLHETWHPVPRTQAEPERDVEQAKEGGRDAAQRYVDQASKKEIDDDLEGAIAAYSMAIHADSGWGKPRMARGILRQKLGRRKEAIDDFTRSIQLEPGNLRAHAKRGVCYLAEKDYAGAENDFSVVLDAAPSHAVLRAKRTEARLGLDKPWEALEDANALLEAHPDNAEGYYLRGLALERLDDREGAERDFRDAARRNHLDALQIVRVRYGGL